MSDKTSKFSTLKNAIFKGQLILKGLFAVFNFFQKMKENSSLSCKNEFICSFLEEFTA